MKQTAMSGFVATALICILFFAAGCAGPSEQAPRIEAERPETVEVKPKTVEQGPYVSLALRFAPGDSTTYRVALENRKSVQWEGDAEKPRGFTGGHTGNRMEMTFTQQIQSVDDQGNAAARITIKTLKYQATVKSKVTLDFDSSRQQDQDSPLNKLIDQSYTIGIAPSGRVLDVTETGEALTAVKGGSLANSVALQLLSSDAIKEQHTIRTLPDIGESELHTGEDWRSINRISFDLMGARSYEKVYTLKEIEQVNGRKIAVAEMEAFPATPSAKQLNEEQTTDLFSQMSDSTETYAGKLRFNLTDGKAEQCDEKLLVEWLIVNPNQKPDEPPAALRMAAMRLYSLERID